jgi:Lipid desaturase domain
MRATAGERAGAFRSSSDAEDLRSFRFWGTLTVRACAGDLRLSRVSPSRIRKEWIDGTSVVAFACVWCVALLRFAPSLLEPAFAWATLAGALAGYLLADLVAGTVHWIADRHFDPETPGIGPMLIEPFRAHHDDPLSITRHDYFEVLGNNSLVTLPAILALLVVPQPESALAHFSLALGLAGTLAAVVTNLFHAWAHSPEPPRLARWLQARGVILTSTRHALHHRGAHDHAYCVTSGWLNPLLDRTRCFARLDAWITRRPRSQGQASPR